MQKWKASITHEFWEREDIKRELMSYLKEFSRNSKAYDKQTSKEVEESTKSHLRGDFEDIEVSFVVLCGLCWAN